MDCIHIALSGPVVNVRQDAQETDVHPSEPKSLAISPGTPIMAPIAIAVTENFLEDKNLQGRQVEAEAGKMPLPEQQLTKDGAPIASSGSASSAPETDVRSSEPKSPVTSPDSLIAAPVAIRPAERFLVDGNAQDVQPEIETDEISLLEQQSYALSGVVVNEEPPITDYLADFAMEASENIHELEALRAEFEALSEAQKDNICVLEQKFQKKLLVIREWIKIWNVHLKAVLCQLWTEDIDDEHKEALSLLGERVFLEVKNLYIPLCLDLMDLGMPGNDNMQLFLITCEEFYETCLTYQEGLEDLVKDLANEITDEKYSWDEKIELIKRMQTGIAALQHDETCNTRVYGLPTSAYWVLEKYRFAFQAESEINNRLNYFWNQFPQEPVLDTYGIVSTVPDELLIWDGDWIKHKMRTEISPLLEKLLSIRDNIPEVLAKCLEIYQKMRTPEVVHKSQ